MASLSANVQALRHPDVLVEARRVPAEARQRGIVLRLMGGVGVLCRCPRAELPPLAREYGDIDFFGRSDDSRALISLFEDLGYTPEPRFNALHGHRRLLFKDAQDQHRDVLLDRFEMCHTFELGSRLEIDEETIPLADLLLTKLQIVEANAKDLTDAIALLVDHQVADGPAVIDAGYIARLCSNDWGLERTISESAVRVVDHAAAISVPDADLVRQRVAALIDRLRQEPKSRRWKMRARVGERVRWYELPEEIG